VLDVLFPPRCVLCSCPGVGLCGDCASALTPAPEMDPPDDLDDLAALCDYEGSGRDLVLALKRRNRRDAVGLLGRSLATALAAPTPDHAPAAVTWAPTTTDRRRARGFDQAEELARAVARSAGLPCRRLLARRGGGPQHGRNRAQRLAGPGFVPIGWVPRGVVLVDDVVASGATMSAAAAALRRGGAHRVVGLALARSDGTGSGAAQS